MHTLPALERNRFWRKARIPLLVSVLVLAVFLAGTLLRDQIGFLLARGDGTLTQEHLPTKNGQRTYRLYIPRSLSSSSSRRAPLIIMLHAASGTGLGTLTASRFDLLADKVGAFVVYPDGINETWNAELCCDPAVRWHIDDVGFLSQLIAHIERTQRVDPKRVYIAGMSNGAVMAYVAACHLGRQVAAIAAVAGDMNPRACHPSFPVAVLHIHGTADYNLSFQGGHPPGFPPVSVAVDTWRRIDGCRGPVRTTQRGRVSTIASLSCKRGTAVILMVIRGGGHAWPGEWLWNFPSQLLPKPSGPFDATGTIWSFFAAHPRQ